MDTLDPKAIIQRYYEKIGNQRRLAVADDIVALHFKLFPDSLPPYGPEGSNNSFRGCVSPPCLICIMVGPFVKMSLANPVSALLLNQMPPQARQRQTAACVIVGSPPTKPPLA